jgi:hypothetical protein
MKRARVLLTCLGLIVGIFFVTTAPAYSSGYPFAAGLASSDTMVIVVGKFDSSASGFTYAEAEGYSQAVASAVGLLGTLSQGVIILPPSQLASYGLTDADALNQEIKNIYVQSGFSLYIFLDITKVDSVQRQYGRNVRIDVWAADMVPLANSLTGDSLTGSYLYVTTIEVPETYLSALASSM